MFPCEIEGVSIVLIGSFNPSIFTPDWFGAQELLNDEDRKASSIEVVSPQLTSANLGKALKLLVQPNKFQIETSSMDLLPTVRDLVFGTFKILSHTPITAMGMNHHMHFKMPDAQKWHQVGDKLAPKGEWDGVIDNPGLLSVQIQGNRPGSTASKLRVSLEPSSLVQHGVYVMVNEHYAGEGPKLLDALANEWEGCHTYAREVGEKILDRCLQEAA